MGKSRISEGTARLVFIFLGVLCLGSIYFFYYRPTMAKIQTLTEENEAKRVRVQELQGMLLKQQETKDEIAEMQADMEEITQRFPAKWSEESIIYLIYQMEQASGVTISTMSFQLNAPCFNGEAAGIEETVTKVTVNYGEITYDGLKKMVDFINQNNDRMTIDALNCSYSSGDGMLSGSLNLNLYALEGTGREYEAPPEFSISKGVTNVFRNGAGTTN